MSINIIWSILMQGKMYDSQEISRKTTSGIFNEDTKYITTLNALVPYTDQILRSFQVEQLVHLVLVSSLRERALQLDPVNTYEKTSLMFPPPGTINSDLPNNTRVMPIMSPDAFDDYGSGQVVFKCSVNPATSTFSTVHGLHTFTMSGNLSSLIPITGGFWIRFKGDIGSNPFTFELAYIAEPVMNWLRVWSTISNMSHKWTDSELKDIYTTDLYWQNRLSAVILSAVENSIK